VTTVKITPLDADTERRYREIYDAEAQKEIDWLKRRYPTALDRACPRCKGPAGGPCLRRSSVFGNRPMPTDTCKARIAPEVEAKKAEKVAAKSDARAAKQRTISEKAARGEINTTTGECQICEGRYKVQRGAIALHGYERPGFGFITGRCWGAGQLPYEQSCDALHPYLKMLNERMAGIVRLEADRPDMTVILESRGVGSKMREFHRPGPEATPLERAEWNEAMRRYADRLKSDHDSTQREINRVTRRIDNWAPRELSR